jgi:putative two-component system response regulator
LRYYTEVLTGQFIEDLVQCSILHDIGKVAIPDSVLFNPSKFNLVEFETMKQHSEYGAKAIEDAIRESEDEDSHLLLARDIAYFHHERWDGSGYPNGLKGEQIPLCARIVALADVYDALTTERRYKRPYTHDEAKQVITQGRAMHFDPKLVDAFMDADEDFRLIKNVISGKRAES